MTRLVVVLGFLVAACVPGGVEQDAGTSPDASVPACPDAGACGCDAGACRCDGGEPRWLTRLEDADGGAIQGELVAVYDQNLWWHSQPDLVFALFDPAALAAWPGDRSLTLVASSSVAKVAELPWPAFRATYRDTLRRQHMVLEQAPLAGPALVLTAHEAYHREEDGYGDFAWDLVLTDAQGARFSGDGTHNPDYLAWGAPVTLPKAGLVVEVVRNGVDNEPGAYPEGAVNNMVGVALGGAYYLYLLHFQAGSIPEEVQVGASLGAGALLGRVGNAGVSLEPHLHVTLLWLDNRAPPGRTWSVPGEWENVYLAPSPRGPVTYHDAVDPPGHTWVSSSPF